MSYYMSLHLWRLQMSIYGLMSQIIVEHIP